MNPPHTRQTDEQLLIQFVEDTGSDMPDLMEAAKRLEDCITEKLQGYSVPNIDGS